MKKTKKFAVSILCGIMAVFLCFFLNIYSVKAASSASVSVEGASGNVGDEVSVKITISSSDEISAAYIYLSYVTVCVRSRFRFCWFCFVD